MDTADGLSVTSSEKRLEVMRDSATGAFGAIAAIVILLLKTVAISEISLPLWLVLMFAAGWGRWGQVMAIALYPYLRERSISQSQYGFAPGYLFGVNCFIGI